MFSPHLYHTNTLLLENQNELVSLQKINFTQVEKKKKKSNINREIYKKKMTN